MVVGGMFILFPKICFNGHGQNSQCQNTKVLNLVDDDEPGERLMIYGKVVDRATKQPIINANLFFYQADTNGNYKSTFFGMPSYAKIRGKITTDNHGCFQVLTIVPGNYPGQNDGKHIHVIAKAKGHHKWQFEFLFEGWISENLRKEIKSNNDAIILDLQNKQDGKWVVGTEINLRHK